MTCEDLIQKLQADCLYQFKNPQLLQRALTHSSADGVENYERLEFLGDRVVGLAIAETLFKKFPDESEGKLAKRHASLVQGEMLAVIAQKIDLGAILQLSDAEHAAGGAENDNILADVLEALIGAIYIDANMAACKKTIDHLWEGLIDTMTEPPRDPKTALQEWAQAKALPLPAYDIVGKDGPDHAPIFEISVTVQGFAPCIAKGSSRRKAEKEAASMLLKELEETEGS